jgi:hypothetical protein
VAVNASDVGFGGYGSKCGFARLDLDPLPLATRLDSIINESFRRRDMAGLLLFVLIGGYLYLAWWAIQKPRALLRKAFLLLVFVLVPTADAFYGRIELKHLCEKDGGLKIFQVIENVEGFYDEILGPTEHWIKKYGFRYVEGKVYQQNNRLILLPDGKLKMETDIAPRSIYLFSSEHGYIKNLYGYSRKFVKNTDTNEVLGTYTSLGFRGGWIERGLMSLFGQGDSSVAFCYDKNPDQEYDGLVTSVLKPTTK